MFLKKFFKKRIILSILLAVLVLSLAGLLVTLHKAGFFVKSDVEKAAKEDKITKGEPQPPVKDHILVKFKANVSEEKKQQIHEKTGGKVKDKINQIGVEIVQIPPGKGIDPEAFVETYKGNFKEELEFAEPDYLVQPALSPNDPYWVWDWQPKLARLGAEQAWDITTGNPSVVIGVIDSGLYYTHPDFQGGRVILGPDYANNDNDPWDDYGHGTITTGVLGATTNNGVGIAGTTWGNRLLIIKMYKYDAAGVYGSHGWMAQGLVFAADYPVKVALLEGAGPAYSSTLANAVKYAYGKGVVMVAPTGNYVDPPQYPAAHPGVIAVSGIDGWDKWATGYGPYVAVCAYASGVYTTCAALVTNYYYGTAGGTSVAAPFVAGAAGLILSVNPELTPAQVRDIIQKTADDLGDPGWDQYYGWGRVNLYKAVVAASGYASTTGTISGKVTDVSNGTALSQATISALQAGAVKAQSQTDVSGNYTLPNLSAGTYDVKAEKPNYQTQTQSGKSVTAGGTTTVNFVLTPQLTTGNITGKVTDTTGTALASATVSASQSGTLIKSTITLSDGTYTLSNLEQGTYDLTASLSGYTAQTKTGLSVLAGQTTSGINFSLSSSTQQYGSLTGVVTDSSGQVQSGIKVTAQLTKQIIYTTATDSSGIYTFTNIPAGTYTLKASSKGQTATKKGVVITAGQITTANLTLGKKQR